jgi:predicted deacylase
LNDVLTRSCLDFSEIEVAPEVSEDVRRLVHGPRVVGELRGGGAGGPTLICVGSVHGNEPSGALALDRIFTYLQTAGLTEVHGRMVGLLGNRRALAKNRRFLSQDLNRFWDPERAERLRTTGDRLEAEALELRELDHELERILRESEGHPVYLLDLHTTSGPGPAFGNLDDTLPNREFALKFPVPLVVGIEEEISGTLTNYAFELGVITLGFESGQHDDPTSIDRAEAAIWVALEASGVLPRGSRPEIAKAWQLLRTNRGELPHVVEIRHREAIRRGSGFQMRPGYRNLQAVKSGEIVASDHRGVMKIGEAALILMPLYQAQGDDGFFLVRPVRMMWLHLSTFLRRRRLGRFLHYLPGVRAIPDEPDRFSVNRRYARWFALELFHLLGFRRRGEFGRYLLLARRPHDS